MSHLGNHVHRHVRIYGSRWHLAATFLFILVPFVFLVAFTRLSQVELAPLLLDLTWSFWRLLLAYVIAVVLAWLLAVITHKGKRAAVGLPIFDVLQSFPTFAALPLATYFFGISNWTVILFLVLTVIWPMLFSIISSLKLIRRDWEEAVQMARLSGWEYVRRYLWPVSIPGLVTGSIIGLGEGWEAVIATEIIVGIRPGLGGFFQYFSHNATITALGIVGFLLIIFVINKLIWLPLLEWGHRRMED